MNITTRKLRITEIALVPFDNNIFFVIRFDKVVEGVQLYKVQLWNKSFDSYGETSYNLTYYEAKKRLAYLIS